jgi:hypothetical protein
MDTVSITGDREETRNAILEMPRRISPPRPVTAQSCLTPDARAQLSEHTPSDAPTRKGPDEEPGEPHQRRQRQEDG